MRFSYKSFGMVILLVSSIHKPVLSKISLVLNKKVRFIFNTAIKLNKIGKVTIYLDDQREEDMFLNEVKNLGEPPLDVPEIFRFAQQHVFASLWMT